MLDFTSYGRGDHLPDFYFVSESGSASLRGSPKKTCYIKKGGTSHIVTAVSASHIVTAGSASAVR